MINCNCKDCAHNNYEDRTCKLEEIWITDDIFGAKCLGYEEEEEHDRP